jgi:transposase|nr:transposase [Rhodoferax sp.]
MYTTPTPPATGNPRKRSWRKHSDEFKARVVALALEPHASMASVALAHGINANMLRCWVRASSPASPRSTVGHEDRNAQALSFVQLPIQADKPLAIAAAPATSPVIEVQIQRGETRVVVSLPMIGDSATWVREVLG